MIPRPLVHRFGHSAARKAGPLTELTRRADFGQIARTSDKAIPTVDADPYLLVLLADQELSEGREEQARHLVEATYESFDRQMKANIFQLRVTG